MSLVRDLAYQLPYWCTHGVWYPKQQRVSQSLAAYLADWFELTEDLRVDYWLLVQFVAIKYFKELDVSVGIGFLTGKELSEGVVASFIITFYYHKLWIEVTIQQGRVVITQRDILLIFDLLRFFFNYIP